MQQISSRKSHARQLFSSAGEAEEWNALYQRRQTLLDHHFIQRRDSSCNYIADHVPTTATVLDLGCGAGALTEALLKRHYRRVQAVDQSTDMLALAAKRLRHFEPQRFDLTSAEAERLPFANQQFDAIACLGMFGYLDRDDDAMSEIARVLKPGGLLLLSVRNRRNQFVFDPLKLPKRYLWHRPLVWARRLKYRLLPNTPAAVAQRQRRAQRPGNGWVVDILDRPSNVIAGVRAHGLTLEHFWGIGFGPLMLNGRPLMPQAPAIRISRALQSGSARLGLDRFSRHLADVSVFAFRRAER